MNQANAHHLLSVNCDLGEGPLWHPSEHCLYWVDIEVGHIHKYFPGTKIHETYQLGLSIGALGFREQGGLILATGQGFAFWDPKVGKLELLINPLAGKPGVRMNDGKVDPAGRFWAGSLDHSGNGALYRFDPDLSCHQILSKITISNGLDWSPDQKTFYYTDSADQAIYSFEYDQDSGCVKNRQIFVHIPSDISQIVPDGLAVDAEGYIWSACWDGGKVIRYNPLGEAIFELILPVSRVTSLTFGGENLDGLFITTAATGLNPDQLDKEPLAGDLFYYKTNTFGKPASFFRG